MSIKKIDINEEFLEKLSNLYISEEQGVNSSVAMWSNIKKHNEMYISGLITKNECMFMVEFLAGFKKCMNLSTRGDLLREIDDIMICGVEYPGEKELEIRWGCNLIHAEDAISNLIEICRYMIVEWAIIYRGYDEVQKKTFERYIEKILDGLYIKNMV
jgi:hypothetical protein